MRVGCLARRAPFTRDTSRWVAQVNSHVRARIPKMRACRKCFALTREHDFALNARGTLFYFYSFVSNSFSSAVE